MKFTVEAFHWLQANVAKLGNIRLSSEELEYLQSHCPYLNQQYLDYLQDFRLRPSDHVELTFESSSEKCDDKVLGSIHMGVKGLWVETILFEVPLLALTSEAYFRFCSRDWNHDGQREKACRKGLSLLENGCLFSEFGTRRRRDYRTQVLVLEGLKKAEDIATGKGWKGKLTGTSNVHFAMKTGLPAVGTVAHEWFMAVAAITNDYENATETALRYWIGTFGEGVLGIALTDTFGTPTFLKSFSSTIPAFTAAVPGKTATLASSAASSGLSTTDSLSSTETPSHAPPTEGEKGPEQRSYAQAFSGIRQDSGNPAEFVKIMRNFYDKEGITEKKTIVFSDSLNIELCLEYKQQAEDAGFQPTFGIGTFFTNDFVHQSTGKKSTPLNIVIKLSSANGNHAVKISDNIGKNTGYPATVEEVKQRLGYVEKTWENGNEEKRWGTEAEDGI
ncbi:MAG: hypothetical protein M1825_002764 [Sarcosagium campestre]|nr:MAG: hypothetical protein M1825_002764 [Sarcosagium campestre]